MQWWLSCCGATNSTKLAQRQIMICGATKLWRQRERGTNVAFGVNAQCSLLSLFPVSGAD